MATNFLADAITFEEDVVIGLESSAFVSLPGPVVDSRFTFLEGGVFSEWSGETEGNIVVALCADTDIVLLRDLNQK
ncbi:hypothetical protein D3C80_1524990 [compost metagenome]